MSKEFLCFHQILIYWYQSSYLSSNYKEKLCYVQQMSSLSRSDCTMVDTWTISPNIKRSCLSTEITQMSDTNGISNRKQWLWRKDNNPYSFKLLGKVVEEIIHHVYTFFKIYFQYLQIKKTKREAFHIGCILDTQFYILPNALCDFLHK